MVRNGSNRKNKNISIKSIDKIYSTFRNIDIADISLVQSLYNSKNYLQIGRVLGKDSLPQNTEKEKKRYLEYTKALGRLANQYITLVSNPSKLDKKHIKKKFRVRLTDDFQRNIWRSGNRRGGLPPNPEYIAEMGGILDTNRSGILETRIEEPNIEDFVDNLQILTNHFSSVEEEYFISTFRILMKLKTTNNQEIWVSTSYLHYNDYAEALDFIENFEYYIDRNRDYYYQERNLVKISEILELRVRYE